jgi:hypothetical protein
VREKFQLGERKIPVGENYILTNSHLFSILRIIKEREGLKNG